MIYGHSLRLRNYVVFADIKLRLDTHPITVIRGLNLDKKVKPSRNGVGKTLLASCVHNIRFNAPIGASRKVSAKDVIDKDSSAEFCFWREKSARSITQYGKPNGAVGYRLIKDGKDLKIKDQKVARVRIASWLPYKLEHSTSLVYVSRALPSPLLHGTGPVRHDFFEHLFNLEVYDLMHAALNKEYGERQRQETLAEQAQERRQALGNRQIDLKTDKQRLKELDQRYTALSTKLERFNLELQDLVAYTTLAKELTTTLSLSRLQEQQRILRAEIDRLTAYHAFVLRKLSERNSIRVAAQRRFQLLQKLRYYTPFSRSAADLEQDLNHLDQQLQRLEKQRAGYREQQPLVQRWERKVDEVVQDFQVDRDEVMRIDNNRVASRIGALTTKLDAIADSIRSLNKTDKAGLPSCPTCGTALDREALVRHLSKHTNLQKQLQHELQKWQTIDRLLTAKANLQPLTWTKKDESEFRFLRRQYQLTKLAATRQAEYERVKYQLASLEAAYTSLVPDEDPRSLGTRLDKLQRQLFEVENNIKLRARLTEMQVDYEDVEAASQRQRQLQKFVDQEGRRVVKLHEAIARLTVTISEDRTWHQQVVELEHEIEVLESKTTDLQVYGALVEAYSSRGMRTLHVEALARSYVKRLNRYSGLLFSEPFRFDIDVRKNQFELLAERNRKISDIYYLSGAESRSFLALSCFALLPFLPAQSRCSFIFLDELESEMSPPDRQQYATQFIPQLATVVPHVFLTTPMPETSFYVPNAHELLLVKKGGISRFENSIAEAA